MRFTVLEQASVPKTQDEAGRAIFDDRSKEVIVVLPTGGGKSLFYMLGSLLDDGHFTLVVIPLRALIYDIGRQLDRHHLGFEEWTSDSQGFGQKVVLVSADSGSGSPVATDCSLHKWSIGSHCV